MDRCLYTRVKEHAKSDKPEIFNHVHNCDEFHFIRSLLKFPANLLDCNYSTSLVDLIYSNCKVIDRSNDWSHYCYLKRLFISIVVIRH